MMDKELPVVPESESPLRLVTSWTNIYRSLWEQPRHPYYIFCPDYRENSAGVLALHMLCHALNIAGYEAFVTAQVRSPRLKTPLLTPEIEEAHRAAQNTPITVYPEIVSGNPRNAEVVVRYLLNTPGHLAGDTSYAEHEILFAHRQQFVPPTMRAETLWIPVSDLRIFNPSGVDAAKRSGSCFYTSRYTERGGVLSSETEGFLELSQRNPRSLRELAEIFRRSEFLYSYEPSALCTQAMLCGCPVVYLPNDYMTEFPAEELLGRDGAAWGSSPEEIQRARDTVGLIFGKYQALAAGFDAELTNFIQITQKAADDYQSETTASAALPDSPLPEAFVLEPEWSAPDWASVLTAYLHAFLPGEPVALILAVEADQDSLEDVQHRVLEVVDDTGLQEFAEVLLVDKTSELEETLKKFHRVQWLLSGNEQSQLLEGAAGTRLSVAMQRLHEPNRLPMPVFDKNRPLRIAVFSMDRPAYACALIRLLHPLGFLGKAVDCHWAFTSHGTTATIDMQAVAKADVIVVQRVFPSRETAEIIDGLLRSGKPIIYETDDLLTEIPEGNSNNTYARENRDYLIDFIRRIDLVTVSTQALVGAYRQHNKRVYVLPNLINETLWVDAQHSFAPVDDTRPVTIGFAGTTTHSHDLALIESALERVVDKYGERVSFIFMGCITERLRQLPRVSFHEFADGYEGYARHLQTLDIDIALVPLADNPFNRCKSNIKWLEYSARGIAGVYSEITPYSSCIENGRTGMLVSNDSDAWFAALDHLIANPRTRQAIARSARDAVRAGYTLEKGASQYLRVYGKAIDIGETRQRDQAHDPGRQPGIGFAAGGLGRLVAYAAIDPCPGTVANLRRHRPFRDNAVAVQVLLCATR